LALQVLAELHVKLVQLRLVSGNPKIGFQGLDHDYLRYLAVRVPRLTRSPSILMPLERLLKEQ
jgi:hypothetical protein